MTKIDSIVKQALLEKGLSLHFYIRFLSWGLHALKELGFDVVGKVKTVELYPDEFSRAPLPCDYVDWVRVGCNNGQYVVNLGETNAFNRKLKETDGVYVPYGEPMSGWDSAYVYGYLYENGLLAPNYGGSGTRSDEFMILKEHGVIQFNTAYKSGSKVTMDFIYFDEADSDMEVEKYSEAAILAYMEYRYACSMPRGMPYDKAAAERNWTMQQGILRARKNPLTVERVKRIVNRNAHPIR